METTNQYATNVEETVTSTTSKLVKFGFKALVTTGKVIGQTAGAIAVGAKQGYDDAKSELTKAPF